MGTVEKPKKDSALYRIAKDVGFNARVEPMWYTFERLGPRMGFLGRWRERRRLRRLIGSINRRLEEQGAVPGPWDAAGGECVCNLRVAREGLIVELQMYLRERVAKEEWEAWGHLMAHRDRNSYLLPIDFDPPLSVTGLTNGQKIPVGSAPRLRRELEEVNRILRVDDTFALSKVQRVDYLDATEREIALFESRHAVADEFWAKFAYVILKKLADMSVEKGFPAIFA